MAYIYKIINSINQKIYIGKTLFSIEKRFKEHLDEASRTRSNNRPLYNAIKKYGKENFSIELVEKIENEEILEEREKFWIEHFNSYKNGYNATIGGDGKKYLNHDLIISYYKELQNAVDVALKLNISQDYVLQILKENQIETLSSRQASKNKLGKKIKMFDLNGNFEEIFDSLRDAARYIILQNSLDLSKNLNGIKSHIGDCAKGKRKTAYKHKWEFI